MWVGFMRYCVIGLVVCLLATGGWATGQLPPVAQRHEVKQIISLDQEQKIAFLLGVDQGGGRVEFFSVPVYEIISSGKPYTDRLVRKDQGEILEIGGTGSGDSTRLIALLNTGKAFVFTVTPPSQTPTPLKELSEPERILQSAEGFKKIRATPSHLIVQKGAKDLVIFDANDAKFVERQRIQSATPITDFMVESDRVIVQAQQDVTIFDLQGKVLAQVKRPSPPIGIGAFETGLLIYDEKTLTLLDRNGARTAEVKMDQPIKAVAAARETVAIISGTQTLLLTQKGERIASVAAGERLTSSANRFFLSQGQEIWILDATTGKRLKVITLRNQLENFTGLRRGLVIVVRQRDTNRLIYAVYDEQGDQLSLGFLLEFQGPRP